MKRDCPGHPKTLRLRRLLNAAAQAHASAAGMFAAQGDIIRKRDVLGILEALWLSTAQHAPTGDLSRWDPADIAEAVDWDGPAESLIEALLAAGGTGQAGFLERHPDGRLVVHDWAYHAQDNVHSAVARAHGFFWDGSEPRRTRIGGKERAEVDAWYADARAKCAHNAHAVRTDDPLETPPTEEPKEEPETPQNVTVGTDCARRAHAVRTESALPSPSHMQPSHMLPSSTLPDLDPQQPKPARPTPPRAAAAADAAGVQVGFPTATATARPPNGRPWARFPLQIGTDEMPEGGWPLYPEFLQTLRDEYGGECVSVEDTLKRLQVRLLEAGSPEILHVPPERYLRGVLDRELAANRSRKSAKPLTTANFVPG